MSYSEQIKNIRIKLLLSQEAFAKELNVSFATVNRWETGKTKPNISAIRELKRFCLNNEIEFKELEKELVEQED